MILCNEVAIVHAHTGGNVIIMFIIVLSMIQRSRLEQMVILFVPRLRTKGSSHLVFAATGEVRREVVNVVSERARFRAA